jgi:hypothetical protein
MGIHCTASLALLLTLGATTGCAGDPASSIDRAVSSTTDTASTSAAAASSTTLDDASESTSTGAPGTTAEAQTTTVLADDGTTGEPASGTRLRALHLGMGTGSPTIDVYVDGEGPVFEALEFRGGTGYLELPPGDTALAITRSGEPLDAAMLASMIVLEPDEAHTLAIIGDLTGAPGMQSIGLVDDSEGVAPDSVRITFVHAAHAKGPFDLFEISGEPVVLLEDLEFGHFVPLEDLPAHALALGIELDLDDDSVLDVTFDVDLTDLAGQQLNLYAHDDPTGAAALVVQLADGQVLTIDAD